MLDLTTAAASLPNLRPPTCDRRAKTGARRICGARATHYDARRRENVCGRCALTADAPIPGTGTPWYAATIYGCDTPGHEDRPMRRIVDGKRMCFFCSGCYAVDVEAKL